MAALYGFAFTPKALAFLKTLQPKLRKQMATRIEALAKDPLPQGAIALKDVEDDGERVYRIRQGKHRIIYVIRETVVVILIIDHRKDAYR